MRGGSRVVLAVWSVVVFVGGVATGAEMSLVPVGASGSHTIVGNEIRLMGGGQRVFLELRIAGWDPDLDGTPLLRAWQAAIDSSGFSSGTLGALIPARAACGSAADCLLVFGGACSASGGGCSQNADCPFPQFNDVCRGPTCGFPVEVGGFCTPAFILAGRSDYVFRDIQNGDLNAVDLSSPSIWFRFASAGLSDSAADQGIVHYAGTLVLDVPLGTAGTFPIGFFGPPDSKLVAADNNVIVPLTLTPAIVVVRCVTTADCNDQSFCTDDSCQPDGQCSNVPNFAAATNCCDPRSGETCPKTTGLIGDGDGDGRVDLSDFAILQSRCFATDPILFGCEIFDGDCNCRMDGDDVFDYTSAMDGPVTP